MRYKSSLFALMLGLGIYGVAPIVDKFDLFGAPPAQAKVKLPAQSSSGQDGSGDDPAGHDAGDDHGGDDDDGDDHGSDGGGDDHGNDGEGHG